MSMLIALDPRGIDLAYPAEFERRSDPASSLEVLPGSRPQFPGSTTHHIVSPVRQIQTHLTLRDTLLGGKFEFVLP